MSSQERNRQKENLLLHAEEMQQKINCMAQDPS
jgi:hypothetical protein